MFDIFLELSVPLACGIAYRLLPSALPAQDLRRAIGSIALYVFIPLLTFGALSQVHMGEHLWAVPVVSITTVLSGLVLSYLVYGIALRRTLAAPSIGALILAGTWCNAMYLGLPVTTAVLGDEARHIPIEFDYLGMTPLLFSVGTLVCVHYGSTGSKTSWYDGLRQAISLPPTLAVVIALVVNWLEVPIASWVSTACMKAGAAVPQLMLFSIGLSLSVPSARFIPRLLPAVVIRIVVVPVLLWSGIEWLISDPIAQRGVLLETAMPTMMLTMVFAERYKLDTELLAQAIFLSTAISVFTLPTIASLL